MSTQSETSYHNIISRLRWRMQDASQMGFHVRAEPLDGLAADWCRVGRRKIILLDAAQPATEQLSRLNEILDEYQSCIDAFGAVTGQGTLESKAA